MIKDSCFLSRRKKSPYKSDEKPNTKSYLLMPNVRQNMQNWISLLFTLLIIRRVYFSCSSWNRPMGLGFKVFSLNFVDFVSRVDSTCSSLCWLKNESCKASKPVAVVILVFRHWWNVWWRWKIQILIISCMRGISLYDNFVDIYY